MVNWSLLIALGFVNWFATFLLVESEFFRPYRQFVDKRYEASLDRAIADPAFLAQFATADATKTQVFEALKVSGSTFWNEARYFVHCHTCTGVWVGFVLAAAAVHPLVLSGFVGFVVTALAIKALGHITLDVVAVLKGNQ